MSCRRLAALIVSVAFACVGVAQTTKPADELKALAQALTKPARYGLPARSNAAVERLVAIGSAEAVEVL